MQRGCRIGSLALWPLGFLLSGCYLFHDRSRDDGPVVLDEGPGDLPRGGCFEEHPDEPLPLGYRVIGFDGGNLIGIRPDGARVLLHRFGVDEPLSTSRVAAAGRFVAAYAEHDRFPEPMESELVLLDVEGVRWVTRQTGYWTTWDFGVPIVTADGSVVPPRAERVGSGQWAFVLYDVDGARRAMPPELQARGGPDDAGGVPVVRVEWPGPSWHSDIGFAVPGEAGLVPPRHPVARWLGVDGDAHLYLTEEGGRTHYVRETSRHAQTTPSPFAAEATTWGSTAFRHRFVVRSEDRVGVVDFEREQVLDFGRIGGDRVDVVSNVRQGRGDRFVVVRDGLPVATGALSTSETRPLEAGVGVAPAALGVAIGDPESFGVLADGRLLRFVREPEPSLWGAVYLVPESPEGEWRRFGRRLVGAQFVRSGSVGDRWGIWAGRNSALARVDDRPSEANVLAQDPNALLGQSWQYGAAEGATFTANEPTGPPRPHGWFSRHDPNVRCVLFRAYDPGEPGVLVDVATGRSLDVAPLHSAVLFPSSP